MCVYICAHLEVCDSDLGIEDGTIGPSQLEAEISTLNYPVQHARLYFDSLRTYPFLGRGEITLLLFVHDCIHIINTYSVFIYFGFHVRNIR